MPNGIPSKELIYDIGDLGESELLTELMSKNPDNRSAAIIEIAERFGKEDVLGIMSRMKKQEMNENVLIEIDKAIISVK